MEAHHHVHGPDPGRNSGGRGTEKALFFILSMSILHPCRVNNLVTVKCLQEKENIAQFCCFFSDWNETAELIENTNSGNIFCCLFGLNPNIDFNPMTNKYLIYGWLWRLACCVFCPVFWCSTHTKAGRNTFFGSFQSLLFIFLFSAIF